MDNLQNKGNDEYKKLNHNSQSCSVQFEASFLQFFVMLSVLSTKLLLIVLHFHQHTISYSTLTSHECYYFLKSLRI